MGTSGYISFQRSRNGNTFPCIVSRMQSRSRSMLLCVSPRVGEYDSVLAALVLGSQALPY